MQKRVLITGAGGFVGPYVAAALHALSGDDFEIVATARQAGRHPALGELFALDICDAAAVAAVVEQFKPDVIIHLAAISAIEDVSKDPDRAWSVNLDGTRHLANAVMAHAPSCWLLHVGSGMAYGDAAQSGLALDETAPLLPRDDYGASKAAADLALGAMARRGVRVIRLRPFNHAGAGQREAFVLPAFAMQIARIEAGRIPPVLRVGNLDAERDFLDVRDVAHAYALAVRQCETLSPGEAFNIASGVPRRIGDVLEKLLSFSSVSITVEQDRAKLRPSDLPRMIGDASRARQRLAWQPLLSFDETIRAVLDDCRARVARPEG